MIDSSIIPESLFLFNSRPTGLFCILFCCLLFFKKSTFSKNSFRNTIRLSNSLDPDQAQQNVGPYLGSNCFQMLSADGTNRQRVKEDLHFYGELNMVSFEQNFYIFSCFPGKNVHFLSLSELIGYIRQFQAHAAPNQPTMMQKMMGLLKQGIHRHLFR